MRIATFNIENLDDQPVPDNRRDREPSFEDRAPILRAQLERLRADVICLQEVHGQDEDGEPRDLRALKKLMQGTRYEDYQLDTTRLANGQDVERFRNLVFMVAPDYAFAEPAREIRNDFVERPAHKFATGNRRGEVADIGWERPILYVPVTTPAGDTLHLINAHFKSKRPTRIPGQGPDDFKWASAAGWAEGFFLSSLKRVGQALETRMFVDTLFDDDPNAQVVICGDLNAEPYEVPMQTLRGDVGDTGNPALNNRILYPLEHTIPEPSRYTLYHRGKRNLLDHVLVSQSLLRCYRTTEIHNELLRDETTAFAFDSKFPASDHAPMVAEFGD
ncbi:MAG: endonuclease/exonuclease/phosphatase family protein [Pseudomonadota bacterium]